MLLGVCKFRIRIAGVEVGADAAEDVAILGRTTFGLEGTGYDEGSHVMLTPSGGVMGNLTDELLPRQLLGLDEDVLSEDALAGSPLLSDATQADEACRGFAKEKAKVFLDAWDIDDQFLVGHREGSVLSACGRFVGQFNSMAFGLGCEDGHAGGGFVEGGKVVLVHDEGPAHRTFEMT